MRISDWSSDVCSSDLQLLDALDRIAFAVEQRVDPAHQRDIAGAVIAPLAGALERPQLGKARFPIAQDVLRQPRLARQLRSEEHTSELQSLMRISYAVFCMKKKINHDYVLSNLRCE